MGKWITANFSAGLLRGAGSTLVGILFGAVCVVFGVDPKAWLALIWTAPPEWLDHPLLKLGVIVLGLAIIGVTVLLRRRRAGTIPLAFELRGMLSFSAQYPFIEAVTSSPPNQAADKVLVWNYGPVVFANVAVDRNVSVDIFLRLKKKEGKRDIRLRADGQLHFGLTYGRNDLLGRGLQKNGLPPIDIFVSPLLIPAQHSVEKHLVFLLHPFDEEMRGALVGALMRDEYARTVEITDHISGRTITVSDKGKYRGE